MKIFWKFVSVRDGMLNLLPSKFPQVFVASGGIFYYLGFIHYLNLMLFFFFREKGFVILLSAEFSKITSNFFSTRKKLYCVKQSVGKKKF